MSESHPVKCVVFVALSVSMTVSSATLQLSIYTIHTICSLWRGPRCHRVILHMFDDFYHRLLVHTPHPRYPKIIVLCICHQFSPRFDLQQVVWLIHRWYKFQIPLISIFFPTSCGEYVQATQTSVPLSVVVGQRYTSLWIPLCEVFCLWLCWASANSRHSVLSWPHRSASYQASDPYVMILHTLDLYSLSRRFRWSHLSTQMCHILPNCCLVALYIRHAVAASCLQTPTRDIFSPLVGCFNLDPHNFRHHCLLFYSLLQNCIRHCRFCRLVDFAMMVTHPCLVRFKVLPRRLALAFKLCRRLHSNVCRLGWM